MKSTTCPYCGTKNQTSDSACREVENFGKAVIECSQCKASYLLRDDGDGVFVCRG